MEPQEQQPSLSNWLIRSLAWVAFVATSTFVAELITKASGITGWTMAVFFILGMCAADFRNWLKSRLP